MPDPIRKTALSRHAVQRFAARPELAAETDVERAASAPFDATEMARALAGAPDDDEAALKRRLRRLRERVLLRTMARDLEGLADLAEVCSTFSDLAELCIRACLAWLRESELIVVAMGKLGGRELNVSSDIDLVFVYPEEGETVCAAGPGGAGAGARSLSNHEYFTRLGRRLINVLADVTEDGQVFRVDMRLRPNGDSGPLACSFDALENYFIAEGREWERYAWIKARVVAAVGNSSLAASGGSTLAASGSSTLAASGNGSVAAGD